MSVTTMDTCTLLHDFLAYLRAEKGYSPLTVRAYESDLLQFWTCANSHGVTDPGDVTTPIVRRWVADMSAGGMASPTIARHICALRSFWRFVMDGGYADHDPVAAISTPKRKQPIPTCLSAGEVQALLDAAGTHPNPVVAARDFAIITMLAFTGMRRGELLALELADVNRITLTVHVRGGKGGKDRVIPLTQEVLAALDEWLAHRPPSRTDALFTTTFGNRIHPSRIQIIWKRVLADSGITRPGVTLHTLRHSFATLLLQNGADLVTIQKLLGHTRLDTTAVYLHYQTEDLREGLEKHPLAAPPVAQASEAPDPPDAQPQSVQRHWRVPAGRRRGGVE